MGFYKSLNIKSMELRANDLVIGTYKDRETEEEFEIVRLDFYLAKSPEFIAECRAQGVRKLEPKTTE